MNRKVLAIRAFLAKRSLVILLNYHVKCSIFVKIPLKRLLLIGFKSRNKYHKIAQLSLSWDQHSDAVFMPGYCFQFSTFCSCVFGITRHYTFFFIEIADSIRIANGEETPDGACQSWPPPAFWVTVQCLNSAILSYSTVPQL